jgi:3-deoxy-D-manno-octulosonic-acid transferase
MGKCGMAQLDIRTKATLLGYRFLSALVWIFGLSWAVFARGFSRRISEGLLDFLGFLKLPKRAPGQALYWVHGVSMGESMVAFAFIEELRFRYPEALITFTTTHPDVYRTAKNKGIAAVVGYFPLDFYVFMKRAFDRWRPNGVFVVETDFWPEFSWQCRQRGVPLFLINGRVSYKIEGFYSSCKSLARMIFGSYKLFCVQGIEDKRRLEELGVVSSRIKVLGNIKAELLPQKKEVAQEILDWCGNDKPLIFGSLHPSEFEMLKDFFVSCQEKFVLAPRNIKLGEKWCTQLKALGVKACLRSELNQSNAGAVRVLVLDSMGELFPLYSKGAVGFVGGTLDPRVGGHNPLEVMFHGVPLVMGPFYRNFADLVEELRKRGGVRVVKNLAEVQAEVCGLLVTGEQGGEARRAMAVAAFGVLQENQGVLEKTLQKLELTLDRVAK